MVKKILNKQEAMQYLGVGRKVFESALRQGDLPFKLINHHKYFPVWVLDKWLNDTTNLLDYSKGAKSTTHTSRSYPKDNEFVLENLLEQLTNSQQRTIASNAYRKSQSKTKSSPQANCLA